MGLLAPPVRGSGGLTGSGSWSLRGLWWQWWDGAPGLVRKLPAAAGASLGGDDTFWSCRSLPACTCYFGVGGGGQCGPRLSGSLPAPPSGEREQGGREARFCVSGSSPFWWGTLHLDLGPPGGVSWRVPACRRGLGWGEEVASGHFLRLPVAQCGGSGWGWGASVPSGRGGQLTDRGQG